MSLEKPSIPANRRGHNKQFVCHSANILASDYHTTVGGLVQFYW